jgi:bifunctional non-homologous end joining protein LigD
MALEEYQRKRDFARTPEPAPAPGKGHRRPIFVVQEHHASRLHYDFRLEADGVLKSWAVPKGPSLDPAQKRLAVRVEDHPLGYADFEGTIPEGHYGAGEVQVWDRGTYDNLLADGPAPKTVAEGIAAGRLEFALHGRKLQGRFALVRMRGKGRGKENWLLIKMKDEFARPEEVKEEKGEGKKPTSAPPRVRRPAAPAAGEVELTSLDKLMYPAAGITKGDVIDYYRQVAPRLLPYLKDRPVTLERLPEGVGEGRPHFWQKNTPDSYPDWVPRVELPSEGGKRVRYALVNEERTLLYLVNQGALTFHVWASRVGDLDRPDFVLLDLDPGEATFADVVRVASEVRRVLKVEGVKGGGAFVKTSGKSGLHVLVAWFGAGGYEQARGWAEGVAWEVTQALPEIATTQRGKDQRGGRVYVDVMQNARGKHAVPPYVLRAVPGAPVSMPLSWREVTAGLDPGRFNLKTIFRRLARQKRDPMAALLAEAERWRPRSKGRRATR